MFGKGRQNLEGDSVSLRSITFMETRFGTDGLANSRLFCWCKWQHWLLMTTLLLAGMHLGLYVALAKATQEKSRSGVVQHVKLSVLFYFLLLM